MPNKVTLEELGKAVKHFYPDNKDLQQQSDSAVGAAYYHFNKDELEGQVITESPKKKESGEQSSTSSAENQQPEQAPVAQDTTSQQQPQNTQPEENTFNYLKGVTLTPPIYGNVEKTVALKSKDIPQQVSETAEQMIPELDKQFSQFDNNWINDPNALPAAVKFLESKFGDSEQAKQAAQLAAASYVAQNSRKLRYEQGLEEYKQAGITPKEVSTDAMVHAKKFIPEQEAKAAQLFEQIKQEYSKKKPDVDKIAAMRDEVEKMGYNPNAWRDYEPGMRIPKGEPTQYDSTVNNLIAHYSKLPLEEVEQIMKQNYIINNSINNQVKQDSTNVATTEHFLSTSGISPDAIDPAIMANYQDSKKRLEYLGSQAQNNAAAYEAASRVYEAKKNGNKDILGEIYHQWPALKNMGETVLKPDESYTKEKTKAGSIEYFSPKEEEIDYGNGYKYKHPAPGKNAIVYNPKNQDEQSIRLDMLHGMVQDKNYKQLRDRFKDALLKSKFGADVEHFYEKAKKEGYKDSKEQFITNWVDGKLRNLLFKGRSIEDYKKAGYNPNEAKELFKDENIKNTFEDIKYYLTTGHINPKGFQFFEDTQVGRGMKAGAKEMAGSVARGFKEGAIAELKLWGKLFGNTEENKKEIDERLKDLEGIDKWAKDVPKTSGKIGEIVGGILPLAGMVVASILTRNPEGLADISPMLSTMFWGTMGYGEGTKHYEDVTYNEDKEQNELKKQLMGSVYGAVYTLPLTKFVGRVVPKGARKAIAGAAVKVLDKAGVFENMSPEVWDAFVKQHPKIIKSLTKDLPSAVGTMEAIGTGKDVANYAFLGEGNAKQFAKNRLSDLVSGVVFHLMTGPFIQLAKRKATVNRWKKQKEVVIGIHEGKPIEIIETKDGHKGLTPDGKIVDVNQEAIDNAMHIPTGAFLKSLEKGKVTKDEMVEAVNEHLYNLGKEISPNGKDVMYVEHNGKKYYFKKKVDKTKSELTSIDGETIVFENIKDNDIKSYSIDDFVKDVANEKVSKEEPQTKEPPEEPGTEGEQPKETKLLPGNKQEAPKEKPSKKGKLNHSDFEGLPETEENKKAVNRLNNEPLYFEGVENGKEPNSANIYFSNEKGKLEKETLQFDSEEAKDAGLKKIHDFLKSEVERVKGRKEQPIEPPTKEEGKHPEPEEKEKKPDEQKNTQEINEAKRNKEKELEKVKKDFEEEINDIKKERDAVIEDIKSAQQPKGKEEAIEVPGGGVYFRMPESNGSFKSMNSNSQNDGKDHFKIVGDKLYYIKGNGDRRAISRRDTFLKPVFEYGKGGDEADGIRLVRPAVVRKTDDGWTLIKKGKVVFTKGGYDISNDESTVDIDALNERKDKLENKINETEKKLQDEIERINAEYEAKVKDIKNKQQTEPPAEEPPKEQPKQQKIDISNPVFTTGKYHIVKDKKTGEVIVADKDGNPVTDKTKAGRIITQYRKKADFDKGKSTFDKYDNREIDEDDARNMSQAEIVATHSENPAEVLKELSKTERYIPEEHLDAKDVAIARNLGKITSDSYNRFADRNKTTMTIARSYFAKKDEYKPETIDQVAMHASEDFGSEITPDDIVNFIYKYPKGSHTLYEQPTPEWIDLNNRFIELTGISATPMLVARYEGWEPKTNVNKLTDEDIEQILKDDLRKSHKKGKLPSEEEYNNLFNDIKDETINGTTNETKADKGRKETGDRPVQPMENNGGENGSEKETGKLTPYQQKVADSYDEKITVAEESLKKAKKAKDNELAKLQQRNGLFGDIDVSGEGELKGEFVPDNIKKALAEHDKKIAELEKKITELKKDKQNAVKEAGMQQEMDFGGEDKQPIKVKPLKVGDGHTKGVFVDENGNIYKSLWTLGDRIIKDGKITRGKSFRTDEYDILKSIQDLKHVPKVGKIVNTTEGEMFEIEPLKEVEKGTMTYDELQQIKNTLDELAKRGIDYNDIPKIMRRENGDIVLVDFSDAAKDVKYHIDTNLMEQSYEELMKPEDLARERATNASEYYSKLGGMWDEEEGNRKEDENKHEYLLTQRPPSIGTHPTEGLVADPKETKLGNKTVWVLKYDRELTPEEINKYELVPNLGMEQVGTMYSRDFGKGKIYHVVTDYSDKNKTFTVKTYYNNKVEKKSVGVKSFYKEYFNNDKLTKDTGDEVNEPLTAYHGSPHKFNKFDKSKIGTGEGAQAYGYGLYFTDKEGIARDYAKRNDTTEIKFDGKYISDYPKLEAWFADEDPFNNGNISKNDLIREAKKKNSDYKNNVKDARANIKNAETEANRIVNLNKRRIIELEKKFNEYYAKLFGEGVDDNELEPVLRRHLQQINAERENLKERLNVDKIKKEIIKREQGKIEYYNNVIKSTQYFLDNIDKLKYISPSRNLYKVKIHGDKDVNDLNFIRWDRKVDSGIIKKVIQTAGEMYPSLKKDGYINTYLKQYYNGDYDNLTGERLYNGLLKSLLQAAGKPHPKDRSEFLLKMGIDGIKYPSEYTTKGSHEDSFNYVVFDDKAIDIDEHIVFEKRGVFNSETPEFKKDESHKSSMSNDPAQLKLWKDNDYNQEEPGDVTYVERILNKQGKLQFSGLSGNAKIKSSDDVAFLFKNLEDAVTENAFAVLTKEDGSYEVLYLGTGGTTGTIVDLKQIYAAALDRGATSITMVHNHPSGTLEPSPADQKLHRKLKEMFGETNILVHLSVIIDTDKGMYSIFDHKGLYEQLFRPKTGGEFIPAVYQFDKQKLYVPSSEKTQIKSPEDIGIFLSKQKRGTTPKIGALILGQDNTVNRIVMYDETIDAHDLIADLKYQVAKHGERVILYSNKELQEDLLKRTKAALQSVSMDLLDAVTVQQDKTVISNADKFSEPTPEYKPASQTDYFKEPPSPSEKDDERSSKDGIPIYKVELPEAIEFIKKLTGYPPFVKELRRGLRGKMTVMRGAPETARVIISKALYRLKEGQTEQDVEDITKTLWHEIGHLIDAMPDGRLKRGNILGHISAAKEAYLKSTLGKDKDSPTLTPEDRKRLQKEAKAQLKAEAGETIREVVIDFIKNHDVVLKVTPEDVVKIWNGVAGGKDNPKLYDFIARLSGREKAEITRKAMQGILDDRLKGMDNKLGSFFDMNIKVVEKPKSEPTAADVRKRFKELLKEEIKKREIFQKETIERELKEMSLAWKPFDASKPSKYQKYRFSPEELYADAISVMFNNPKMFQEMAPEFNRAFFNWLDVRTDVRVAIKEMMDIVGDKENLQQHRLDNWLQGFKKGHTKRLEEADKIKEKELNDYLDFIQKFVSDREIILRKLDYKNTDKNGLTQRENVDYALGRLKRLQDPIAAFMYPLEQGIVKKAMDMNISLDDLGVYFAANRVLNGDRGEFANPLGMQTKQAKETLKYLVGEGATPDDPPPKYTPKEREAMDEMHKLLTDNIWKLIEKGHELGLFTDEQFETMKEGKGTYVPFNVVKYINNAVPGVNIHEQKGTHQEIENPIYGYTAFGASLVRAIRTQEAFNTLNDIFGGTLIHDRGAVTKYTKKVHPERDNHTIKYFKVDGKLHAFEMPDFMAKVFDTSNRGFGQNTIINLWRSATKLFKLAVTMYKPAWLLYSNPSRDVRDTLQAIFSEFNSGGMPAYKATYKTIAEYLKTLGKGLKMSVDFANFKWDDEILHLLDNEAIFTDYFTHFDANQQSSIFRKGAEKLGVVPKRSGRSDFFSPIYKNFGLIPKEKKIVANKDVTGIKKLKREAYINFMRAFYLTPIPDALDILRYSSNVLDMQSKITGYEVMKKYMPEKKAMYKSKKFTGTPDITNAGTWADKLDFLAPFYKMITASLERAYDLGIRNPKTRKAFWKWSFFTAVVPGIVSGVISALMYVMNKKFTPDEIDKDPKLKKYHEVSKMYNSISGYDRFNYQSFPVGVDKDGNVHYIRFVMNDVERLTYATTQWLVTTALTQNPKGFKYLFNTGVGLTPSLTPLVEMMINNTSVAMGRQGRDWFHDRPIVPESAKNLGLKTRGMYLAKYDLRTIGLGWLANSIKQNPLIDVPKATTIPVLSYIYKVGGQGEREAYDDIANTVKKEDAKQSQWIRDKVVELELKLKKEGKPLNDIKTIYGITDDVCDEYRKVFPESKRLPKAKIKGLAKVYALRGTNDKLSNLANALAFNKGSKEQAAILMTYREWQTDAREFKKDMDYLMELRLVSKDALMEYDKMWRDYSIKMYEKKKKEMQEKK